MAKTLTKEQLKYARDRILTLSNERLHLFITKLGDRPVLPEFTQEAKLRMIQDGKAKIKSDLRNSYYGRETYDFFEFPPVPGLVAAKKKCEEYDAKIMKERERLDKITNELTDELVMSDNGMEAMAKIATAFK